MIIVTSENIAGKRVVRTLGLVRGNTVRARHVGKDIMAGLRNIVGGEIHEYAKLIAESREQTIDRMVADARITRGERDHRRALHDVGDRRRRSRVAGRGHGGRGRGRLNATEGAGLSRLKCRNLDSAHLRPAHCVPQLTAWPTR